MVDRNIINKLGLSQEELDERVSEMFGDEDNEYLEEVLKTKVDSRLPGTILKGTIVSQIGNDVIIEIGLKSEGVVDASEFDSSDEIEPGKEVEVLLEDIDSAGELIPLSKRKADRIRGWETIIETKKEGDIVSGKVIRRIKGGLLVDIGVPVFLPASQVDIRRPGDISRFIGKEIESKILKIDVENRNIVISRRKLIEEERRSSKENILDEIEVGQLRKGVVKNIADFGVFVDLGGLDGLLHISDLSWGRISHPSEVVKLDEEIECVVIGFDKQNEKISLGLKQKTSSPWEDVEHRYPIGSRVRGKVVNVMNYGVFIRLEDGIEGLVHISEMSWTKRLNHPSEILNLGDEIEVIVLSVNRERQEISLGLKQTETNPWAVASQKYPAGTIVTGKVRNVTNFGAFVEIEEGVDGMIHVSDLSWTRKYSHPSEALQRDHEVKCVVLEVDEDKRRVSLGVKQLTEDPWIKAIPEKYIAGHIIKGTVTKLTNFGAFVELEQDLEGLLHISELADHKIEKPQDVVKEGDEVEVKILKVDTETRKIGLSLRRAQWAAEEQEKQAERVVKQPKKETAQTLLSGVDVKELGKPKDKADDKEPKTEAVTETKADDKEPKAAGEPELKVEATTETKADDKEPKAKAAIKPDEAEPEVEAVTETKADAKEPKAADEAEPEATTETKADAKEPKAADEAEPEVEATTETKADAKEPKAADEAEPEVEAVTETKADDKEPKAADEAEPKVEAVTETEADDKEPKAADEAEPEVEAVTETKADAKEPKAAGEPEPADEGPNTEAQASEEDSSAEQDKAETDADDADK